MIGGQCEDSCGKSGAMHGNQTRCPKQSILVPLFNLLIFRWG
ncbi:hypothetical protein ABE056_08080 [Priestia aryabhattai]